MRRSKIELSEKSRKVFDKAFEALGSLEPRELIWLVEFAQKKIAENIANAEEKLGRLTNKELADRPFIHSGAVVLRETETRAELAEKEREHLGEFNKLWKVTEALKGAAKELDMAEFAENIGNWLRERRKEG